MGRDDVMFRRDELFRHFDVALRRQMCPAFTSDPMRWCVSPNRPQPLFQNEFAQNTNQRPLITVDECISFNPFSFCWQKGGGIQSADRIHDALGICSNSYLLASLLIHSKNPNK